MKALKIGLLALGMLGVAAIAAVLIYQIRSNARLRAEIESARPEALALDSLRSEHARLAAIGPARAETVRADREELVRRRVEADALRVQLALLRKTNVIHPEPHAGALANTKAAAAAIPVPAGMLTPEALQNVGRETPTKAWQTYMWAMLADDRSTKAESIAIPADPRVRDLLKTTFDALSEEEKAGFENPEQMALRMAALEPFPELANLRVAFPRMQVVSETPTGPDAAALVIRYQNWKGELHDDPPEQMHRFPDGWKLMLDLPTIHRLSTTIIALPPSQRAMMAKR
jgi:hypothetical protein